MQAVIIGNGITGITAALTLRRLQPAAEIIIVSAEQPRFFSRPALMYAFMGQIRYQELFPYEEWFWKENRLILLQDVAQHIDSEQQKIHLKSGKILSYDKLLLATGSEPALFNWPGQNLPNVVTFNTFQDLVRLEELAPACTRAVIVGGGLIGVELAEMLHSRNINVTILVRGNHYWDNVLPPEEGRLVARHLEQCGITLQLQTELTEIIGNDAGKAIAVKTSTGEKITCDLVCLATGVKPAVQLARQSGLPTNTGILVNDYLETSQAGIFAAGDCAELINQAGSRRLEQLWYTGRQQGETAGYNLAGHRKAYQRGIWFNSAKFFKLEFQTYGQMANFIPEAEQTLYWQNPVTFKSIRINYKKETGAVTGFNLLGIRYRQEVCENWIRKETNIREVLSQLSQANFDPEFSERFELELVAAYKAQHPEAPLTVHKKKPWFKLFF